MRKLNIFENPEPYNGHTSYQQVGNYEKHPIYISDSTPKEWIAHLGFLGEISINDEVFRLLKSSQQFERFLETICEHEVRNGYGSHNHDERTGNEIEVLEFLIENKVIENF